MLKVRRTRARCLAEAVESRLMFSIGQLEPLFGGGDGKLNTHIFGTDAGQVVLEQLDGKIVVVSNSGIGFAQDISLTRYLPNGQIDTSYGSGGTTNFGFAGTESVSAAAMMLDGRVVVVGTTNHFFGGENVLVARFAANGALDTTFNTTGYATFDFAQANDRGAGVLVLPDNKVVVAATASLSGSDDFAILRLNANGSPDTTFNGTGRATTSFGGTDVATSIATDSFNRYVIAGYSDAGASNNAMAVARFNTNGSINTSLDGDGRALVDFGWDDRANAVAVDRNDRIVLVGSTDGGSSEIAVARLMPNGALDTSFNDLPSPVGYNGDGRLSFHFILDNSTFGGIEYGRSVQLTNGDGIVIGGYTNVTETLLSNSAQRNFAIAKIEPEGYLDPSFGNSGRRVIDLGGDDLAFGLRLTRDNSVLVAGSSANDVALIRLRGMHDLGFAGGSTSFGPGGPGVLEYANAVALQPDGKYVVAGYTQANGGDFLVARYNPNGTLDTTFDNALDAYPPGCVGIAFGTGSETAMDLALLPNGAMFVVGYTNNVGGFPTSGTDFAIAKLTNLGLLDPTFSGDGLHTVNLGNNERANAVAIQPNGKIVVAGSWDGGSSDFAVLRLQPDGSLDSTFGNGSFGTSSGISHFTFGTTNFFGGAEFANEVALLPDGRIVVAGHTNLVDAATPSGGNAMAVALLTTSGRLDTSFDGDGRLTVDFLGDDRVGGLVVQPDSRIVVAGSSFVDGQGDFRLFRIDPTGAFDNGFGFMGFVMSAPGGAELTDLALASNGQLVAVGRSNSLNPALDQFVALRYQSDGTIDVQFQPRSDGGARIYEYRSNFYGSSNANAVALSPNGSIILAGNAAGDVGLAVLHPGRVSIHSAEYRFDGVPSGFSGRPAYRLWFTPGTDLSTLSAGTFTLRNTTTNTVISPSALWLDTTVGNGAVHLHYTGAAGILPDGNYTLSTQVASFSDTAGNFNMQPQTFSFHVLAGDVNRDRTVNFDDLLILAQNYGQTGKTFSQGNIDYSADGLVGFDDLLILAQRYGTSLVQAPPTSIRRRTRLMELEA